MTPKQKIILRWILFAWRNYRAKKIAKKITKFEDVTRYPLQWRNDYVLKRAKKFLKLLNVDLEVVGFENIPKNTTLMAPNHQSSIDSVALLAALESVQKGPDYSNIKPVFLAKFELKKNRKFIGYMNIINTFYINRKKPREALKVIDDMANYAKSNNKHIVIFPEGTRSLDGKLNEFKGGAFRVAKKFFLPIIPITIDNSLATTNFNRKKRLKITVTFHKLLKPMSFITMNTKNIGEKVASIVETTLTKPSESRPSVEAKIT